DMARLKYNPLDMRKGAVVREDAARQMAVAGARLRDTDVGVSTTGVAGPAPMEGQPVGTLFVGVSVRGHVISRHCMLDGDPSEIRSRAVHEALELTTRALSS